MSNRFGLLGEKLSHSISPQIHQEILKYINRKGSYKLIETSKEKINSYISEYDGLNVTIPYKVEVIKHLESISDVAKKIGAVNTIYNGVGYNTDYFGFGKMINIKNIDVRDKIVYILGTGGASKAVYQYLIDNNAKQIKFVSRLKKGKDIISYNELNSVVGDIIINTTPIGMYPKIEVSPINMNIFKNFKIAIDLIYNPLETKFLLDAKKLGLLTVNGLYMLIGQAIKAEEIWNKCEIDEILIDKIYNEMKRSEI
ncbi:MAG: shikimate dehydrogenase [Bacillota bacterium]|nr:shikimate dehydrogenase [Bacillota bacterium]